MAANMRASLSSALLSSWSTAAKGKAKAVSPILTSASRTFSNSSSSRQPAVLDPASSAASSTSPAGVASGGTTTTTTTQTVIESTPSALALLKSQPQHYIVASIVGKTLLLTTRDVFTIPRLRDVQVGDVIELDRIHEVGSRDYTLRAQDPMNSRERGASALMRRTNLTGGNTTQSVKARLPEGFVPADLKTSKSWATRLFPAGLGHVGAVLSPETVRARCVVVEHTKGAMERIVKFKRRKGYKKTVKSKQPYTRIRLEAIKLFGE